MKENVRTIILIIVLAVLIGFMIWVTHQSDNNLQSYLLYKHIAATL